MHRPRLRLHRSPTPVWVPGDVVFADQPVTGWHAPASGADAISTGDRRATAVMTLEQPVPALARIDARVRHTVLVVSRQREVRRHLRGCLDGHAKLRLADVASVTAAVSLAREVSVHLIIADPSAWSVTRALPGIRTILLANDSLGRDLAGSSRRQHVMQRPFSPETLAATVHLLLREPD